LTPEGNYNLTADKFRAGFGCNETVLNIFHYGTWSNAGPTNIVTSGSKIIMTPSSFSITPYTDETTNKLAASCPCKSWSTGVTVNIKKGEVCANCNPHPWLNMDLAAIKQYGIFQRRDQGIGFLRMSEFYTDSATGWNRAFAANDYDWAQIKQIPPSPSPAKNNSGLSAGGVLLLIVFLGAFVYFAVGIGYNYYYSQGTMALPQAEFWHSLPGLISDGFKFTFVDCFGARSGSVSRGVVSTGSTESYKPVASKSGYGAL